MNASRLHDLVLAGNIAQAIEVARALPALLPTLEDALVRTVDTGNPAALLKLVVKGDVLNRELVRYAMHCARSVEHLWGEDDRATLSTGLLTVDRWLAGEPMDILTAATAGFSMTSGNPIHRNAALSATQAILAAIVAAIMTNTVGSVSTPAALAAQHAHAAAWHAGSAADALLLEMRGYLARRTTALLETP